MSMDYYIYLKQINRPVAKDFEQYCKGLGLNVTVQPEFAFAAASSYLPMRLIDDRFSDAESCGGFKTGFEISFSAYQHEEQPVKKAGGLLRKLFPPKPTEETGWDRATKDCDTVVSLQCRSFDSFSVLMAYVFGAYLVRCRGGVFDDPQTGQFYDAGKHLELEIAVILEDLVQKKADGALTVHPFSTWTMEMI